MYTRFTTFKPTFIFLAEVMIWGVMCTLPIYVVIVVLGSTGLYYVPIPFHMWAPVVFMVVTIIVGRIDRINYKSPHPDQSEILADYAEVLGRNKHLAVVDDAWLFSLQDIKRSLLNALYQAKTNPYYGDPTGPTAKQLTQQYLQLSKFQPDVDDKDTKSLGTCGGPNISAQQSASLARGAEASSCGPSGCSTGSGGPVDEAKPDNVTLLHPNIGTGVGSNKNWARQIAKDHQKLTNELESKDLYFI